MAKINVSGFYYSAENEKDRRNTSETTKNVLRKLTSTTVVDKFRFTNESSWNNLSFIILNDKETIEVVMLIVIYTEHF